MKKLILLLSFTTIINSLLAQRIDSIEYNKGGGATGSSISFRYHHSAQFKSSDRLHMNYTDQKKIEKSDIQKLNDLNDKKIKLQNNLRKVEQDIKKFEHLKLGNMIKEKYPNINIKPFGKEIHLINK